jgi:hypothetical protein
MKHRVCICVEEETIIKLREALRSRKYRNKSHAFEAALLEVLNA